MDICISVALFADLSCLNQFVSKLQLTKYYDLYYVYDFLNIIVILPTITLYCFAT